MDYAEEFAQDRKKPIPLPIGKQKILTLPNEFGLDDLQKSLIYFLYLTGVRVTEALNASPTDIKIGQLENGEEAMLAEVLTLKNRKLKQYGRPYRIIPTPLAQPIEKQMAEVVIKHSQYYQNLNRKRLFPFTRQTAWNYAKKIKVHINAVILKPKPQFIDLPDFATNPHYYRHCRLTDLVIDYNFDIMRLKKFAGWSSYAPAEIYVSLNWRDLIKPMLGEEKR